jgi:ATP-dependent helicase/nuclease subunit B
MELNLRDIGEKDEDSFALSDGTRIPLSGQVDRVDIWKKDDDTAYLRVTDYKTGNKTFTLEDVEKGFCLQMPLYLMALCRDGVPTLRKILKVDESTKLYPAGVCYFSSAIEPQKTSAPVEHVLAKQTAVEGLKRSGVVHADAEVQSALSASGDPAVLGGKEDKRVTLSRDGFKDLFATLESTIGRIAGNMRSGAADASPVIHDKKSPCDYCSYAAVCRARKKTKD